MKPKTNVTDEGKRATDQINVHVMAQGQGSWNKWVAIKLSDGSTDGSLYDSQADAVRFQLHEKQCAYLCIPPGGVSAQSVSRFLEFNRMLYDRGMRMSDPKRETILPMNKENLLWQR